MPVKSRSDLIRSYFAAYQANDRSVVEAVLTDDFTFTSPYDDAIDRATYFARCWPNSTLFKSIAVERICEDGNGAFVLYRCETLDGKVFRNTELHSFQDGRLHSVEVYFGATYKDGVFVPQQPLS
ncbi:MAG: nuclear transport factor 2 family protein [Mesorhizobium sp.]|uniref:nuclear transport factor 2 family protein n=1 Tax=Mesorhizobium sp. TaxID=1871066 RepID=UPI000FE54F3C|nr:nuclear transport factor 2 family protein [Mesorhizobium sp.]RWH80469.1 MAG: nuclear transport factor 2 family protein [Mesorhizobium sp.]RWH83753.1 MAG: nuclear transport factor 2 family protein [Mesorhizobium sp.]RWH92051.1 MAG: nuclear transport factor 2 family protein [Mesorhizobium sp.]RWI00704.1 MAG: nuclear transport factor 2 family protein [Mesorhizobium sp.]RWI06580.1 MAG: nuclear transport factor 2 family protein [Mesorhizobium sp.]